MLYVSMCAFPLTLSVVILCMSSVLIGGGEQRELLLTALDMGMVSEGYVFIPYDALLYAMPYQVMFMNPSGSLMLWDVCVCRGGY